MNEQGLWLVLRGQREGRLKWAKSDCERLFTQLKGLELHPVRPGALEAFGDPCFNLSSLAGNLTPPFRGLPLLLPHELFRSPWESCVQAL